MGKKENAIAYKVRDYGLDHKFQVRKVSYENHRGCPDYLFYGHGELFFMEFKSPEGDLEPWQVREIKKMRDEGVKVFVVDSIDFGKLIIDGAIAAGRMNAFTKPTSPISG